MLNLRGTAAQFHRSSWFCRAAYADWLTYNKPMEYADLVLNGGIEEYCKSFREHSSIED